MLWLQWPSDNHLLLNSMPMNDQRPAPGWVHSDQTNVFDILTDIIIDSPSGHRGVIESIKAPGQRFQEAITRFKTLRIHFDSNFDSGPMPVTQFAKNFGEAERSPEAHVTSISIYRQVRGGFVALLAIDYNGQEVYALTERKIFSSLAQDTIALYSTNQPPEDPEDALLMKSTYQALMLSRLAGVLPYLNHGFAGSDPFPEPL
ncbi:hypothetical protein DL93DRAFT_939630 [Clavulina sp. PMI_390]|nr:hypothetical protein DL93DRAFT_939630 [Clavulina sp. PMI_390]